LIRREYLAELGGRAHIIRPVELADQLHLLIEGATAVATVDSARQPALRAKDVATRLITEASPGADGKNSSAD
jgi:hypothetical protein